MKTIAVLAACCACWAAAQERLPATQERMPVDRSSVFLKQLYEQRAPADYRTLLLDAAILTVTENEDDGMMLRRFAKRKALKAFLGEPFEFSGTTKAAIALESGLTPAALAVEIGTTHPAVQVEERGSDTYQELRNRALASVTVVPAADGTIQVRNTLKEPVRELAVAVPGGGDSSQSVRLSCKPAAAPEFAPNASQAAAQCSGGEGAVDAFRKAAGKKPVAAHTIVVATENTVIAPNFMRFGGEPVPLAKQAWQIVWATDCKQLDNCGDKDRMARPPGESERSPWMLAALIAALIAIGLLAWRARPRKLRAVESPPMRRPGA